MPETLIVNEIYRTLSGEGTTAGRPCAIVRLTGCNLRCRWCDTPHAYDDGGAITLRRIVSEVKTLAAPLVLVTGGEPLAQSATPKLLRMLCSEHLDVLLETNGSMDISLVDPPARRCVDVKCPGSGQEGSFLLGNIHHLRAGDEMKFVIADPTDFGYAVAFAREHVSITPAEIVFSPVAGELPPAELAEWMLKERALPARARLGLQLHKILWPDAERGV